MVSSTSMRGNLDRYGIAGWLLIASIVGTAWVGVSVWGRLLALFLEGAALLFILWTSGSRGATVVAAGTVVALALASVSVSEAIGGHPARWAPAATGALLAGLAPAAIIRRLARHETVTVHTVFGALCLYLLLGMSFAFVFNVVGEFENGRFFQQVAQADPLDYVYFSFITLATVGYGDLTAAQDIGRVLAATEAILGQLYLVSVVALLVSRVGQARGPGAWRGLSSTGAGRRSDSENPQGGEPRREDRGP